MKYILIEINDVTDKMILNSLGSKELIYKSYRLFKIKDDDFSTFQGYIRFSQSEVKSQIEKLTSLNSRVINKTKNVVHSVNEAFASNTNEYGEEFFKRVKGKNSIILAGQSGNIDLAVTFVASRFKGAEIFGVDLKDQVDFLVAMPDGTPIEGYNFGDLVEMPPGGKYENTSDYTSLITEGIILRCTYHNNGLTDKYIGVNFELHEILS